METAAPGLKPSGGRVWQPCNAKGNFTNTAFRAAAFAGAVTLVALSACGADAAPALTTGNVNLRQGPGTNFPLVTLIPAGSQVEVAGCQGQ